jgi:hypothetical protein
MTIKNIFSTEAGLLNKRLFVLFFCLSCDQIRSGDIYESGHFVVLLKTDFDVQQTRLRSLIISTIV